MTYSKDDIKVLIYILFQYQNDIHMYIYIYIYEYRYTCIRRKERMKRGRKKSITVSQLGFNMKESRNDCDIRFSLV